jgi:hypothetical protein
MAITMDSTLREILASPEATAVVEAVSPGFSKNPQLKMALGMKFSTCVRFPQAGLNPEKIATIKKGFEELAAKEG